MLSIITRSDSRHHHKETISLLQRVPVSEIHDNFFDHKKRKREEGEWKKSKYQNLKGQRWGRNHIIHTITYLQWYTTMSCSCQNIIVHRHS